MTTYNLALTKVEKEVLYHKYKQSGLSSWEASIKVKSFVEYLDHLVKRLTNAKKDKRQIEDKFKEEFEKMCQILEAKSN